MGLDSFGAPVVQANGQIVPVNHLALVLAQAYEEMQRGVNAGFPLGPN
jgi:hypothetical protein